MAMTGVMLADFSAFRKEADSSAASLKQLEAGGEQATVKLSKIGDAAGNIKAAINDPVTAATNALKGMADSIGPIAVESAAAGAGLLALGTAAYTLASNAAATVAVFDDLHDKTDLSVPALSRLSNAAQVIGADMGTLTNVIFKLEQGMGENTDKFQAGLAQMGLSTNELKAAGPDRYLDLITKGLQSIPDASDRAAAGTAVLGKQYRDVAATLNDLSTGLKMTADITPFSAQEAADAEAFQFQVASLKTHVGELATELGVALIPAVSGTISVLERTGLAMVHVADLGGLVSGAWKGIKLSLGEADLAAETFNAVAGTTNRLFQETGATAESVADKMLAMGYSEKTVAEQTGLTAEKVRELNAALAGQKQAAEDNDALWGRVNAKLAEGKPSIEGISSSTRGLAADLREANVSLQDTAKATGLTIEQVKLLDTERTKSAASAKEYEEANKRVTAALVGWQTTLATIPPALQEQIKVELSAGASQADLAKAHKLTKEQIDAVKISLDEETTAMNANADMAVSAGKRRIEITQAMTKASNDAVIAKLEQQKAEDAFLANNLKNAQAADAADIARQTAGTERLKSELQKRADAAKAAYEKAYGDASVNQEKINALGLAWSEAQAAANNEVRNTSTAAADAIGGAYKKNFGDAASAFESFKGVVVGGTGAMIEAADATFNSATNAGAFVEMQRKIRESQMSRGVFFIDTGMSPPPTQTRDSGGPVVSGQSYMIGGGKAPELFVPGASGFVTPGAAAGGSVTNNFYITQPLGTPDAIARAVADAQVAAAKSQGVRLPYA